MTKRIRPDAKDESAMRATLYVTKALADRQRLRIAMMLRGGELCVCQIVEVLGLAPSTVSRHLSVLDRAGLVESRKEGRWMFYRLPEAAAGAFARPALAWLGERLDRDEVVHRDARKLRAVVATEPEALCRRQRRSNA